MCPVFSSAVSGLGGDGRTGLVRGAQQCGCPPLYQTAVLLQEGHTRLGRCLGRGQCVSMDYSYIHVYRMYRKCVVGETQRLVTVCKYEYDLTSFALIFRGLES